MFGRGRQPAFHNADVAANGYTHHGKRRKKSSASNEKKRTKYGASTASGTGHPLPLTRDRGYTAAELVSFWNQYGARSLYSDFLVLKNERMNATFHASLLKENKPKNRYTDILCLDHSRVKLGLIYGGSRSQDYINANFVDGYKEKNTYIAAQGPLPHTCTDFWQMIWEQNVCVIVMTTHTVEKGNQKCAEYWPIAKDKGQSFGSFSVVNKAVNVIEHFTETELLLHNLQTEEERSVTHLFYTGWPDHGVPTSAKDFLSFMFHARQKQQEQTAKRSLVHESESTVSQHPIVVHCSAGIGRTGTFITIDICTRWLEDTGQVNVFQTVQNIRKQRAFSIQTADQYVFCHKALIEYAEMRKISEVKENSVDLHMSGGGDSTA